LICHYRSKCNPSHRGVTTLTCTWREHHIIDSHDILRPVSETPHFSSLSTTPSQHKLVRLPDISRHRCTRGIHDRTLRCGGLEQATGPSCITNRVDKYPYNSSALGIHPKSSFLNSYATMMLMLSFLHHGQYATIFPLVL